MVHATLARRVARRVLSRVAREAVLREVEVRRQGGDVEELALEVGGLTVSVTPPATMNSLEDLPL